MALVALTKFDIISQATAKLDRPPVSSFNDGTEERDIAELMYDTIKADCLTASFWNFNTKRSNLAPDAAVPIDKNWRYSFVLPTDHLMTVSVCDRRGDPDVYVEEGDRIYADVQTIQLVYQSDVDEVKMRWYFYPVLVTACAWQFASPLLGEGSITDRLQQEYQYRLQKAAFRDAASNQPVTLFSGATSPHVNARYGGGGSLRYSGRWIA